jgi:hypothetical protein
MPRIPDPLKRMILPFWNGGHRLAWSLGEYAGAIRHRRFGRCSVCGKFGPWLYRRRVIPPKLEQLWGMSPAVAQAMAHKESDDCSFCGAKLRCRRLADVLLSIYPTDPPSPSVREWVKRDAIRSLRVAEINRIDGLHEELTRLPHYEYSEFFPGIAPGAMSGGIRCEDLRRLTYADGAFDLLLTSETLEHVPDLDAALREIRRVLAPGGLHIFTIPMLPVVARTFARARLRPDGSMEELARPISHPGGDTGYPVFTEFGADFPAIVDAQGFVTTMHFGPVRDGDLGQVFASRRVER